MYILSVAVHSGEFVRLKKKKQSLQVTDTVYDVSIYI